MDNFEYQALQDVVKEDGENVIERFEKMFKEIKVKGNRKGVLAVMYTESVPDHLPETHFTKSELETM